nr:MAG TPA: hypothetical protein [Caudoviricetes sp.]
MRLLQGLYLCVCPWLCSRGFLYILVKNISINRKNKKGSPEAPLSR